MRRDARAYLLDIVEACDAIAADLQGVNLDAYRNSRLIRSAVEREFTIIGEALSALSRSAPELFTSIGHARRIIDFRNRLAHEYANVNHAVVWAIADRDAPLLRRECAELLKQLG